MREDLKNKLLHFEVTPPEQVWQNIENEISQFAEEKNIQSKVLAYSLPVPVQLWDHIQIALDQPVQNDGLASKLYAAEIIPPATAWDKISENLDGTSTHKTRIRPFVRYAAAAVLIGLIGFASIRIFNKSGTTKSAFAEKNNLIDKVPINTTSNGEATQIIEPDQVAKNDDDARNDAALEASKKTYAKLDITKKKRLEAASDFRFSSYAVGDETQDQYQSINATNISDRYVVLMTPEGNFIRVSKKLGNLVCCVSGEEQDKDCKEQVEKWRKQIACSASTHPGNFADILSMLSALQED